MGFSERKAEPYLAAQNGHQENCISSNDDSNSEIDGELNRLFRWLIVLIVLWRAYPPPGGVYKKTSLGPPFVLYPWHPVGLPSIPYVIWVT